MDIELHLCALDPQMVQAWSRHFSGAPNVSLHEGDILKRTADAIVSPANSFGFMDGGIDLVYSHHFGWELQTRLQDTLRQSHGGELPVGVAEIVRTDHIDIPFLISAPTMRVPSDISDTVNVYLAFRAALLAVRRSNAIRSVLSPPLELVWAGCHSTARRSRCMRRTPRSCWAASNGAQQRAVC